MPREVRYCRPKSQPAETLLSHLARKFTYLSHDAWTHHLAEGHVFINGAVVTDGAFVLQQGDRLRFAPPRSLEPQVDEENIFVLYEDDALVACVKNGNLPVAEGGRYCENTLVGVLQRRGTRPFYTEHTVTRDAATCSDSVVEKLPTGKDKGVNELDLFDATAIPVDVSHDDAEHHGVNTALRKRLRVLTPQQRQRKAVEPVLTPLPTFFTVQRLDKETSGVLVLCKHTSAAKHVASQLESQTHRCSAAVEARIASSLAAVTNEEFEDILRRTEKTVWKTYTAVLLGAAPVGETFVVVNSMGAMQSHSTYAYDPTHSQLKKLKMCCEPLATSSSSIPSTSSDTHEESTIDALQTTSWGKVACTRVRVLASSAAFGITCVQVELLTGRSHQIRVHCAALGYPVLGDKLYTCVTPTAADGCFAVPDEVYLARVRNESDPFVLVDNGAAEGRRMWCSRHLLHATQLRLEHPERTPRELIMFVASPVSSFVRDVRFESQEDAQSFQCFLADAFAQFTNRCTID